MNIAIIGNGGREHALAWKLAQSPLVEKIYGIPGNAGFDLLEKAESRPLRTIGEMVGFAESRSVDLTIVGPEAALVEGIVDRFGEAGLPIIGPDKSAARLEGSKKFSKEFMEKHGVKTARSLQCDTVDEAVAAVDRLSEECGWPLVVKADGLAAGKGVVIATDRQQAVDTIDDMMVRRRFDSAGSRLVIEQYLTGFEASVICLFDGEKLIPMPPVKDHKKIRDGEQGANTGGMGTIAPHPWYSGDIDEHFQKEILQPTLDGLKAEGLLYKGFLFFGLMINPSGVYLLEYNVRLGDPETQALLPLLKSDLAELLRQTADGSLESPVEWLPGTCCCVVAASEGYPGGYRSGIPISGLQTEISQTDRALFFAGVKRDQNRYLTAGGRVFAAAAVGDGSQQAIQAAYELIKTVSFDGMVYRNDIGV